MKRIKSIWLLFAAVLAAMLFAGPGVSYAYGCGGSGAGHKRVTVASVTTSKRDDGSTQWVIVDTEGYSSVMADTVQNRPKKNDTVVLDIDGSEEVTGWRLVSKKELKAQRDEYEKTKKKANDAWLSKNFLFVAVLSVLMLIGFALFIALIIETLRG